MVKELFELKGQEYNSQKRDKGSCVAVWDRHAYISEAMEQLGDEKYTKTSHFAIPFYKV